MRFSTPNRSLIISIRKKLFNFLALFVVGFFKWNLDWLHSIKQKETSVLTTFFLLPYLYEKGIDRFRTEPDSDGNHPLVKEVQFHV